MNKLYTMLAQIDTTKRRELILVLLCLIIGFAFRFYTFDHRSLWIDEIHTFNDSKDDLQGQINYYKDNPAYLHPPLFFVLTHLFHPFTNPERDLRLLPLIFGTLSIPLFYFLARCFSPGIAFPCALSLTFMAYAISLSQEGRSYSLILFLGMLGLIFFQKHLKTSKRKYLLLTALVYAILFHMNYSSISFIFFSQILWFYRTDNEVRKPVLSSFLILNGFLLLFCIPWILFIAFNYKGQSLMNPLDKEATGSFASMIYWMLRDWSSHTSLVIVSTILFVLLPFFSKSKKNAILLLAILFLPVSGLYLFCKAFQMTHFISSKYFINFLPLFFITIYLSLGVIETKSELLKKIPRLTMLFMILFIASNLILLPLYYRAEKQNFRGLVAYLKDQIRDGDKIIVANGSDIIGLLHYFKVYPTNRHYSIPFRRVSESEIEHLTTLIGNDKTFVISHSKTYWNQYVQEGTRLWFVVGEIDKQKFEKYTPFVLKGYFDGSFLNGTKFPDDVSMFLFLWDPKSPREKGIDIPFD
jgi:hypothetical protein